MGICSSPKNSKNSLINNSSSFKNNFSQKKINGKNKLDTGLIKE